MSKSTDNIVRMIKAGGNLSINAKSKSTDSLIRIVKTAIKEDMNITLRNLENKSTDSLIRIIKVGKDKLTIEI